MKRIVSLFLAILLISCCIVLAGCGDKSKTVLINGAPLSEYTVIIPEGCDNVTRYAAENFVDLTKDVLGLELTIKIDLADPVDEEILIGATNRAESKTETALKDKEYLLFTKNGKIVMQGYDIYIGGACGDFVNKHISPALSTDKSKIDITSIAQEPTPTEFKFANKSTSVIFMIGDGMGNQHIRMAEQNGLTKFIGKKLPYSASVTTASESVLSGEIGWTDSAAAATAMSTGYKTLNAYLGLDKEGNQLKNIRELAYENGAKTGILTTDVITGGTPAGYLCHHTNRKDTEILQAQIDKITNDKKIDYIKGEVGNSLTDETKYALDTLSAGGSPFFIMIEEAQIDKMSEAHDYKGTIDAVKRFDDAILYAVEFTLCHPDTMLIITADHETGELVPKITNEYKFEFKTYHHTNYNVPVYAIGSGCESITGDLDNTDLAKISAKAFTDSPFGNND